MRHFLLRHHPRYWNGSAKETQSFFPKNWSVQDIQGGIEEIMRQNSADLAAGVGQKGKRQISGTYRGRTCTVGFKHGKIGQFYCK
ncbi:EndoU domain-containing protein [Microbispora sp. NBC_01189]|uniref:EndoU domain-containing protein n=1 Tax=Microbispora sp. NBC_01189 TaxID=2903583 RepID=UPI003A903A09